MHAARKRRRRHLALRRSRPLLGLRVGLERGGQPGSGSGPTDDETYLRGAQVTECRRDRRVRDDLPGLGPKAARCTSTPRCTSTTRPVLTTQPFFDDELHGRRYEREPYVQDSGRDTFNDTDPLYERELELSLSKDGGAYLGLITLDVARA